MLRIAVKKLNQISYPLVNEILHIKLEASHRDILVHGQIDSNIQRGGVRITPRTVRVGRHVLVGGLMSLDEQGRAAGTHIASQARNVFEQLKSELAEAGASMADVVKHNVFYHCDDSDAAADKFIDELDRVRIAYFSDPGPTTTETRVGLDVEGALLLVDAWAVIGSDRERLMPDDHWNWNKHLPFSHGLKVDDLVFVGGQRSLDRAGRMIGVNDIEAQTDCAFRSMEAMLKAAGGDRSSLMRQNTYFRFFGDGPEVTQYWEKMTNVRMRYLAVPSTAGAGIRIPGFPNSQELIQVEGIGFLGKNKKRLQPAKHWDWSIAGNQFTQGWQTREFAFIGGQISADNHARAVGKDIATRTRNVFQFIHSVLREADLDERDVARLYIYYDAPDDWAHIAETRATIANVQSEFYPEPGPVTTAWRASGFAFEDLLIEIEALAVCRS